MSTPSWLIRRVKGSGPFFTQRYEYRIGPDIAPSFARTVRASGGDPRTENARPMTRPVNATEREILDLAPDAQVMVLERVRYIDGAARCAGAAPGHGHGHRRFP